MNNAKKSALAGIKVVDLSRILAGPWASQLLADLGAAVIKIEQPIKGDDTRHWAPPFIEEAKLNASAAYFHCANRNKQSLALDISTVAGQQIIHQLLKDADVLIENFKVGGLAKYGLDYQSLKAKYPKLIYCSITGYGQTGENKHKAGYDAMIQAESGLMSITGEPNGQATKVGVAVTDIQTGLYASNAILAALFARTHTLQGQHIDIALFDVQFATLANQAANYLATEQTPTLLGNAHPNIVPYQTFGTQDNDIMLAVGNNKQFTALCQILALPELAVDARFATNQARVEHRAALIQLLAEKFNQQSAQYWLEHLQQVQIPCAKVNTIAQAFALPQVAQRDLVIELNNQQQQPIHYVANPIKFSDTPVQYRHAAPQLGEHSLKVLTELGLTPEQIAQLQQQGIIN